MDISKRLDNGEVLITLSNKHRRTALDLYQKRWEIETLFGNLKLAVLGVKIRA